MDAPLRLFVEADLGPFQLVLGREQSHYVATVMRRKAGDPVLLFNGRQGEWRARIAVARKGAVALDIEERAREQADEPGPWLLFAPLKRTATDMVVEKAAELGASLVRPVTTLNTNAARVKTARLVAIAREAAEQSGRLTVPEIAEPAPLADALADWDAARALVVLDETGGGGAVAEVMAALDAPPAILIGPEGGFQRSELDFLRDLPFARPCSLGRRLLRAETAALAALAGWQAVAGDWRTV